MSQNEVPALCEACLGPNPHIRMTREKTGLECKLCTRPFTVFRWAAYKGAAMKHTVICITCARQRNCCQSCLLDLTYGIPIQLRDAALKMAGVNVDSTGPQNEISKLYVANNSDRFETLGGAEVTSDATKAREVLTKLAKATQGGKNPKSLTKKDKDILPSHVEKVDVSKIISKLPFNGSLTVPENDSELKTLFIFGIDESLPEYKITDFFEKYGAVKSFTCQHKARAGFLTFAKRAGAEAATAAIKELQKDESTGPGILVIENIPMRVCWGKERPLGASNSEKLKVGTIVGKVLRKLSKPPVTGEKKPLSKAPNEAESPVSVRKENSDGSSNYKALSTNFEY